MRQSRYPIPKYPSLSPWSPPLPQMPGDPERATRVCRCKRQNPERMGRQAACRIKDRHALKSVDYGYVCRVARCPFVPAVGQKVTIHPSGRQAVLDPRMNGFAVGLKSASAPRRIFPRP